jgi:hypothetical protein
MAEMRPIPEGELNYTEILPRSLLPSFNNDTHNYNLSESMKDQTIVNRHKNFNLESYINSPKIVLITMQKLYKVDLFKQTKLFKQIQELQTQGTKFSKKQQ